MNDFTWEQQSSSMNHIPSRSKHDQEWSENLDGFSTLLVSNHNRKSAISIIWEIIETPAVLMLIGMSSAGLSLIVHSTTGSFLSLRDSLYHESYSIMNGLFFCIWTVSLAMLSCFVSQKICPDAVGGGLPEVKAILSGTVKPVLLSKKLIIAKGLGLILAIAACLSVGMEGPLVHMSVALADQLLRMPMFRNLRRQDGKRLDILACACGSGIAASFGTAFGGILFSIELTSTAYSVRNLPRTFLTAICCTLVFVLCGQQDKVSLFSLKSAAVAVVDEGVQVVASNGELINCALLGVICGLLGVLFVKCVELVTTIKNSLINDPSLSSDAKLWRKYMLVFIITMIIAPCMYIEYQHNAGRNHDTASFKLGNIFEDHVTNTSSKLPPFTLSITNLIFFIFFIYKFVITIFSVTLPLPVGLFTPVFWTGDVLGRMLGESFLIISYHVGYQHHIIISPAQYALIGSAAFATGVTRAISTAVIVMELSNHSHLRLPLSIAVIISYFVGNRLSKSVYDVLSDHNDTPILYDLPRRLYSIPAADVMIGVDDRQVLALGSTYADALKLLMMYESSSDVITSSHDMSYQVDDFDGHGDGHHDDDRHHMTRMHFSSSYIIPIVHSKASMTIVGAIHRDDMRRVLIKMQHASTIAHTSPIIIEDPHDTITKSRGQSYDTDMTISSHPSYDRKVDDGMMSSSSSSSYQPIRSSSYDDSGFNQVIQFVLIASDGNSIIPIAASSSSSSSSSDRRSSWTSIPYSVILDPSPYQIVDTMQLNKVDMVFRLLRLNQAYVTRQGCLVGVITRAIIREYVSRYTVTPAERCREIYNLLFNSASSSSYRPIHSVEMPIHSFPSIREPL